VDWVPFDYAYYAWVKGMPIVAIGITQVRVVKLC
jgi:hypothetical protein